MPRAAKTTFLVIFSESSRVWPVLRLITSSVWNVSVKSCQNRRFQFFFGEFSRDLQVARWSYESLVTLDATESHSSSLKPNLTHYWWVLQVISDIKFGFTCGQCHWIWYTNVKICQRKHFRLSLLNLILFHHQPEVIYKKSGMVMPRIVQINVSDSPLMNPVNFLGVVIWSDQCSLTSDSRHPCQKSMLTSWVVKLIIFYNRF